MRPRGVRRRCLALLPIALIVTACLRAGVEPMGAGGRVFTPAPDEREIWSRAAEEKDQLLRRTAALDDRLLGAYLARVVDRLFPEPARPPGAPAILVYVVLDPTLNAFAMPDGHVFVHTGVLARVENEAQLAAVLAREIAHVTRRHAVALARDERSKRTLRRMEDMATRVGVAVAKPGAAPADRVAGAVLSPTANAILGLKLPLAMTASITGYGQDLDRDADREGLERLVKAGYAPTQARSVFSALHAETGERGTVEAFFLGNPARLKERVAAATKLLSTTYVAAAAETGRTTSSDEFAERMRPVVRENAEEDVRLGRFLLAQRQLDRVLDATPDDAVAHLYYGDLRRLQSQRAKNPAERDALIRQAMDRYVRAAQLDATFAAPYRQLGLLHYQQHDRARARSAFEQYLTLAPDAPDAARIREYLLDLTR